MTKYSETSAIARVYTKLHGMLTFHIPGVFSKSSRIKPSYLQPMQKIALSYYYKENNNLKKVKELKADVVANNVYFDVIRSSVVMVMSEILYKTIREEESNEELFNFLNEATVQLNRKEVEISNFLLAFMVQLSKYIGFYPSDRYASDKPYFDLNNGIFRADVVAPESTVKPPFSRLFGLLLETPIDRQSELSLTQEQRRLLLDKVVLYYKIHVSDFKTLNSLGVLREVFKG